MAAKSGSSVKHIQAQIEGKHKWENMTH
jgi:hypothetical protein